MKNDKILVTKSYLPEFAEYTKYLETLWESHWLTNDGALLKELEQKLREFLGVKHVFFVSNGTIALQIAIKALGIKKEIITTPFSFPATPNVILWEGCKPVFVDIEKESMCIDPKEIENAITPNTEAILAVHVYGNPCAVEKIQQIAKKHNLKVIYDAAHTFGATYKGKSLVSYGDVATLSFHATKLFHTGEGGAIVTNDDQLAEKINQYRNFGWSSEENTYSTAGVNGKNSEFHAAMGLANLPKVPSLIAERKALSEVYSTHLAHDSLLFPKSLPETTYNYAYYPVVFSTEKTLLAVKAALEAENIFPRRYFYPSLNTLPYVQSVRCPVSESIAQRVLCLPLYNTLSKADVRRIARIVMAVLSNQDKKPTVTVGIPAFNEAKNIEAVIRSVVKQQQTNYTLKQLLIVTDGSTDNTVSIVRKLQKHYPFIKLIPHTERKGKVVRLNQIYQENSSEFLLTLDADVLLSRQSEIAIMVDRFNEGRIQVVGANHEPIKPKGFLKQVIYYNYVLWNEVRKNITEGDHVANLYGSATMLRGTFAKNVIYPEGITADYDYLYLLTKKVHGFAYESRTRILYKTPTTLADLRKQGTRFLTERYALQPLFGQEAVHMHNIPLVYKIKALSKMLVHHPIYTLFGLMMLSTIRLLPKKDKLNELGLWDIAETTKQLITNI